MTGRERTDRIRRLLEELLDLLDGNAEHDIAWLRIARGVRVHLELDHARHAFSSSKGDA